MRSHRDDLGGINHSVAVIIMSLDMIKVYRVGDTGYLIEFSEIAKKIGVVSNLLNVTFKMSVIHSVKSH